MFFAELKTSIFIRA